MKKSYAKADTNLNRLYIKLAKRLTKKDLDNLYTDIRFCVADLQPGFNVITDLSECSIAALNGVSTFRKISNFLIENRVGIVVRVMNDDSILFRQFINLTSRMQGYKPINVSTLEDAESKIIELSKRSAPRFCLYQQQIEYHGAGGQGSGIIVDISTSGCAVTPDAESPKVGEEISISISFKNHEELLAEFTTVAKVVKADSNFFAVQYVSLAAEQKEQLWNRLVHESRCTLRA